jgi:uncharacterized membrane protein
MIQVTCLLARDEAYAVTLRPNRSLSGRGLAGFVAALALATILTAVVSARQGNVFAPAYALIEALGVAWVLGLAWRRGEREECISLDRDTLIVARAPGGGRERFHPYWVRLRLQADPHGEQHVMLASHGRAIEIGAFLAEDERKELARRLAALLASVVGGNR